MKHEKITLMLLLTLLFCFCTLSVVNATAGVGVFRNGAWYIDNGDGAWDVTQDATINFGQSGDIPIYIPTQPKFTCPRPSGGNIICADTGDQKTDCYYNVGAYFEDVQGCVRFCNGQALVRKCCYEIVTYGMAVIQ